MQLQEKVYLLNSAFQALSSGKDIESVRNCMDRIAQRIDDLTEEVINEPTTNPEPIKPNTDDEIPF